MLQIQNISKCYGSKKVLDHINLQVESGEFFGLLGANGAGKTTLIRLISTLLLPTQGQIQLEGQKITRSRVDLKSKITTVTQEYSLRNDMTVLEIMDLQGRLYHMKSKLRKEGSEHLLKQCGLWEHRKKRARQLSGGMKRMLMLCRALLPDPKIVLLDEPTVGLDPFARRQMWQMIRSLHQRGMTFILTTHYMEEAQVLCGRVALMRTGSVLGVQPPYNWILNLGEFAVDDLSEETVKSCFFPNKEEAMAYAEGLTAKFLVRETNLEDVFLEVVGKGNSNSDGNLDSHLGEMD